MEAATEITEVFKKIQNLDKLMDFFRSVADIPHYQ